MTDMANGPGALRRAFGCVRGGFAMAAILSCAVNLLMLTGPLFMLQVYDRVLASGSVPTLTALLGLVVGLYAMMGVFDFLRTRILSRAAHRIDGELAPHAFRTWIVGALGRGTPGYRPLADVGTLRGFIASPTILALYDLPWFPIYLAVVYVLHLHLGLLATAGAVVVVVLALLNEWLTARGSREAAARETIEARFADESQRNAEGVVAMGMVGHTIGAWRKLRGGALGSMQNGAERAEAITATSKAFRLLLQSSILALGAYLAIGGEITPGAIVAASILAGRALAPLDQTIAGWRMIKRARLARRRLGEYLAEAVDRAPPSVRLPDPKGHIRVSNVLKQAHGGGPTTPDARPILSSIDFELHPGDGLGVIGPSASGKSSLGRLLVGLWMPDAGSVRIDGASYDQWDVDHIGRHVGYLPQEVSLVSGTIAQNIARFDPEADHADIVEAARVAGVHDVVLSFPDGYGTSVDAAVSPLTGGQKQRIALARAVFRRPRLVVLDEPNSNLDAEGDAALARAIETLRADGSVVVVMAHRPSAITAVDKILMLSEGRMTQFGAKADVIRQVTQNVTQNVTQSGAQPTATPAPSRVA